MAAVYQDGKRNTIRCPQYNLDKRSVVFGVGSPRDNAISNALCEWPEQNEERVRERESALCLADFNTAVMDGVRGTIRKKPFRLFFLTH